MSTDVLTKFLDLCGPFQMPQGWSHVPVNADIRVVTATPDNLGPALLSGSDEMSLLSSSLMVKNGEGRVELNAKLSTPGTIVIGLRRIATNELFDLLTPAGRLSSAGPSTFTALGDRHTALTMKVWGDEDYRLLAAANIIDVAILRSIGLPATLANGFNRVGPKGLNRLRQLFGIGCEEDGWSRIPPPSVGPWQPSSTPQQRNVSSMAMDTGEGVPGEDVNGAPELPRLTLVASSLHSLDISAPEDFNRSVAALCELHKHLNLDSSAVDVWRPSTACIDHLKFAARQRQAVWTKAGLVKSVLKHSIDLNAFGQPELPAKLPVCSVPEAIREMIAAFSPGTGEENPAEHREKAFRDYFRLIHSQLIAPMLTDASTKSDPIEQSLWVTFAQLVAIFHANAPLIYTELAGTGIIQGAPVLDSTNVKELLKISDQLVSIAKELKTWTRRKNLPLRNLQSPPPDTQHCEGSDSAMMNWPRCDDKGSFRARYTDWAA